MDTTDFWRLIDASRRTGSGDVGDQAEALRRRLEQLQPHEIVEFDQIFREHLVAAYRWDLWAAAYIINGGCSDDAFEYFRCWLIAQGERVFREALTDPETLATRAEPDVEAESMLYAAAEAYESRTGAALPASVALPSEPDGERWDEDDLEGMYPKLWARFG